jgi:hypothetical protein
MLGVQKMIDHILSWPSIVGYILLTNSGASLWRPGASQQFVNIIESEERTAQRHREDPNEKSKS